MWDEVGARLEEPSARGLAAAVSRAIGDGTLLPGAKLPPIRRVATDLRLSPTTVSAAWQLLARSGAIRADGRRGTVVAEPRATGPRRYRRALRQHALFALDLATGVPDPALLPGLGPALEGVRGAALTPNSYLDEPVLPELASLLRARWPYPPERLALFDGAMDAIDHVASALLRLGDRAVVENPCFPPLLDLLDALGVEALPVTLDAEGPVPASLAAALAQRPAAVFLQPRAHNPTGASWTPTRAAELAALLADGPAIIEDDSAGDIASTPLISLGSWLPDQTVHIGSFSKSHGPDLRLAAASGPAAMLDPILERRLLGQGWTSRLLQHLLLHLLTEPASVAAVAAAQEEYARRRRLIGEGLRREGIEVNGADGLNLWLPVRDEQAALISLASEGISAAAGTAFAAGPLPPHLRITVGLVTAEHAEVAQRLARAAGAGSLPFAR